MNNHVSCKNPTIQEILCYENNRNIAEIKILESLYFFENTIVNHNSNENFLKKRLQNYISYYRVDFIKNFAYFYIKFE